MSELEDRQGVGSAYVFLSGKVKDRGAIRASLRLYEKAVRIEPTNTSFALDYVHILELSQDFKGVIDFAHDFCSRCQETLGRDLELREVTSETRTTLSSSTELLWDYTPWGFEFGNGFQKCFSCCRIPNVSQGGISWKFINYRGLCKIITHKS